VARFRIDHTFAIRSRKLFVFAGEVVEGTIRAGMVIHWPRNPSNDMTFAIHGVELGNKGRDGFVGLTYLAGDADELDFLGQLDPSGDVVEILDR
jgi:hypothetical protein